MIILLTICAFSAFRSSVICQPAYPNVPASHYSSGASSSCGAQPNSPYDATPSWPYGSLPNLPHNPVYPREPMDAPIIHRSGGTSSIFYHNGQLFFTDTKENELCAYHELSHEIFCTKTGPDPLSFAVPVKDHVDRFVLGLNKRIIIAKWKTTTNNPSRILRTFNETNLQENEVYNSGIADLLGTLWFWTIRQIEPTSGRVFSFHPLPPAPQLTEQQFPGIPLSNGIVWNLRYKTRLYCIDGMNNKILTFSYNVARRRVSRNTGIAFDLERWIANQQRPLYRGHAMLGRMTIDTNGRLWVPLYGGSHVLLIMPGDIIAVKKAIRIPAVKVSACVFGGMDLRILYVSTVACSTNETCPPGDQGGKIFAISNLGDVSGRVARTFVMPPRTS